MAGLWNSLTTLETQDLHQPHPRLPFLPPRLLPSEPPHQAPEHLALTRKTPLSFPQSLRLKPPQSD